MNNKYFEQLKIEKLNKIKNLQNQVFFEFDSKNKKLISNKELIEKYFLFSREDLELKQISHLVVGRLRLNRGSFLIVEKNLENIQIYLSKDFLRLNKEFINLLDIGDIILVDGIVMKTKTNQISIKAKEIKLLSKILQTLPEKWHGLTNKEEKYRQRYLDLISNPETKKLFLVRSKIIKLIRDFFDQKEYIEVDTPFLQPILGGAAAKPFITHHNALDMPFYLRIATELPLKKLLVGGFDKVYEIGRIFRNEGIDTTHNPEFTSIEFYQSYSNMENIMDLTENLFHYIGNKLNKKTFIFNNYEIEINKPFERLNLVSLVNDFLKIDVEKETYKSLKTIAISKGITIPNYYQKGHIIYSFFDHFIESKLIKPTFIYNFPIEVSPLAMKNKDNPNFTYRSELFIAGKEFANMFSELNDPFDQLERFENQIKEKNSGNEEANEIDYDFINALSYAMPPAGGCGIGIDRLIMLFTEQSSIRDVLLFPHLKTKN